MANTKEIQRRIKSANNTKKITRAMEMVAAAKMRKSVDAVLRTRTYANLSWSTVLNLSKTLKGDEHPAFTKKEKVENVAIILFSSNRGLCGAFNSAVIAKVHQSIVKHHQEHTTDFILVGKKGEGVHKHFGYNVIAEFQKSDASTELKEVVPIAKMVLGDYLSGKYDKVLVAYTDFISAAKQAPRIRQILPIDVEADEQYLGIVGEDTRLKTTKEFIADKDEKHLADEKFTYEYTFEPDPKTVLNEMIPRLIETQLYQALLESNASEHSARMAAMHQATEAANGMLMINGEQTTIKPGDAMIFDLQNGVAYFSRPNGGIIMLQQESIFCVSGANNREAALDIATLIARIYDLQVDLPLMRDEGVVQYTFV